jgi:hypothetical protein
MGYDVTFQPITQTYNANKLYVKRCMGNDVTFQPITQTYNAKFEKWIIC